MVKRTQHTLTDQLLLGWQLPAATGQSIGFTAPQRPAPVQARPVMLDEGHVMTIAPTGSGKGVGCVIPALLSYRGSMVVIDPKGENYAVTAAFRRRMGQQVYVLDPFGITDTDTPDTLNPLSLLDPASPGFMDDTKALAEDMTQGIWSTDDMFWDISAKQLVAQLMGMVMELESPLCRTPQQILRLLNQSIGELEAIITLYRQGRGAKFASYIPPFVFPEKTASSILAVTRTHMNYLQSPQITEATGSTSIDLAALKDGEPVTLYVVIPPDKLQSHRGLLRIWIGGLLRLMLSRRTCPQLATVFMLDEAAQLGHMPLLVQITSLLRGYGLRLWSVWQDTSQLQSLYPGVWPTLVNNCAAIQQFGFANLAMCQQAGAMVGYPQYENLLTLPANQQLLQLKGQLPQCLRRPNYLTDRVFQGRYATNPFHYIPVRPSLSGASVQKTTVAPPPPLQPADSPAAARQRAVALTNTPEAPERN